MSKIQKVSYYFRLLFQAGFVFLLLTEVFVWVNAPNSLTALQAFGVQIIPEGYLAKIMTSHFHPGIKLAGFLVNMIPTGVTLFILYFLIKLFKEFEKNEIFTLINVNYIRQIAYAILIGQVLLPLYQALIGTVVTYNNPPGKHFFAITFGSDNIKVIIGALIMILVSWIMAEACKLREEQQLTI